MSYSDYGGFCWKNGYRFEEAEDATLNGILAPEERPLEESNGLKLDVLVHAYDVQGSDYGDEESQTKVDFLTGHPHHVVAGSMDGLAILGYKQQIKITWNGNEIFRFPQCYEDGSVAEDIQGEKEGYKYWAKIPKEEPFDITGGVIFKLVIPDNTEYIGVTGYGVGDHFWKDNDSGYMYLYPGDRFMKFEEIQPDLKREDLGDWADEEEWFRSDEAFEEDKKKYNLTDEDRYKPIGHKTNRRYPTHEEWEKYLKEWSSECK